MAKQNSAGAVDVYPIGCTVQVNEAVEAKILRIQISPGPAVSYEVAWWVGGDRTTEWVQAFEITSTEPTIPVGFRPM